jgi:hypothetical protein
MNDCRLCYPAWAWRLVTVALATCFVLRFFV